MWMRSCAVCKALMMKLRLAIPPLSVWVGVEVVGTIQIDESQLTKTPRFYKMKGKLLWPE